MAVRKKKIVTRPRTGLAAISMDKGFDHVLYNFHSEVDKNTLSSITKGYVKDNFNKKDASAILANPDYQFHLYTHRAAAIWWESNGGTFEGKYSGYGEFKERFSELIEPGNEIISERKRKAKEKGNVIQLTPQQRLRKKINDTIMMDLEELEDAWIEGEKPELDIYQRFLYHTLTGQAVEPVREKIDGWLLDYSDAYHKRCDQAVEGYSHLSRNELKRRISHCEAMLTDLDKVKAATKARRKTKAPRIRTADKQVKKLQFLREDKANYKLVSVAATTIPGAERLFTFNVKNKVITEYVTSSRNGFEVSGSTLKNVDKTQSRQCTLRKPEEFLPIVQNKTIKQIDTAWKSLTTKSREPAPRINKETILLRVVT